MRHLSAAPLAAAIALAFASAAVAATSAGKPGTSPGSTGTFISASPTVIASGSTASTSSSSSSTTSTSTGTVTPPTRTTVDVRNQQTLDAVAANHAAGSTTSLGPLAGAPMPNTGTTGTGTTVGSPGTIGIAVPVFSTFTPSDATSSGVVATTNPQVLASNGVFSTDVYGTPVLSANVVTGQAANDAAVNRALRQVSRDRARIGRNGQLLYSIAPRTSVNRSSEMPDDGPSPSLSGYNSALAR